MFSQKAEDTSPIPDFACMMERMVTCYCAILPLCSKETLKIVDDFAIEESDIFEIQAWSIISLSCSPLNAVLQKNVQSLRTWKFVSIQNKRWKALAFVAKIQTSRLGDHYVSSY